MSSKTLSNKASVILVRESMGDLIKSLQYIEDSNGKIIFQDNRDDYSWNNITGYFVPNRKPKKSVNLQKKFVAENDI